MADAREHAYRMKRRCEVEKRSHEAERHEARGNQRETVDGLQLRVIELQRAHGRHQHDERA